MTTADDILNGYALTGTPAPMPDMIVGPMASQAPDNGGYSGGDIGLNYLLPKPQPWPVDNSVPTGSMFQPEEMGFLDNIFPCLNECKGTSGTERKTCLRDCRGKGLTKSQLATQDSDTNAKIAASLDAMAKQAPPSEASSNTWLWVGLIAFVLVMVIVTIILVMRKNAQPAK